MKKMIKGAAVAGLGVALLLGGGGTLAYWSDAAEAEAGKIVAGDLDLEAQAGTWASSLSGTIPDINVYKVIPGESLTYTQTLDVTLEGDQLEASLSVAGAPTGNFKAGTYEVSPIALEADGVQIPNLLDESGTVTASTTFRFLDTTLNRDSVNAEFDFGAVGYQLTQTTN